MARYLLEKKSDPLWAARRAREAAAFRNDYIKVGYYTDVIAQIERMQGGAK